jgi:uncharacterized protein YcfJ
VGALVGGLIGALVGGRTGAIVGAFAGALVGGRTGAYNFRGKLTMRAVHDDSNIQQSTYRAWFLSASCFSGTLSGDQTNVVQKRTQTIVGRIVAGLSKG